MTRLGTLLQLYRAVHTVSLEAIAGEMAITARRLRSIEQGSGSLLDFAKVLGWLLAEPPPIGITVDGARVADAVMRGTEPMQPRLSADREEA